MCDQGTNKAQADYWCSPAGRKWIEHELALDTALSGILDHLLKEAALSEADAVLDVGCGTGASTLAAARRVPRGTALGVDISEPLLDRARTRALEARSHNVAFVLADAQIHAFAASRYDVVISRFGTMFFEDPAAALVNIARAVKPGGRMVFIAWAGVAENPWFYIPKAAAVARLGPGPQANPTEPGPLAFQDVGRVVDLLNQAGLRKASGKAAQIALTPSGTVDDAARVACRVGPAARIVQAHGGDHADSQAIERAVAKAFIAFAEGGVIRIPATVNVFSATVA